MVTWAKLEQAVPELAALVRERFDAHGLGLLDALIAACAVGLSATLFTFNDKHYRVVPGLVTAQPYTR